jgi:hypothetical protein
MMKEVRISVFVMILAGTSVEAGPILGATGGKVSFIAALPQHNINVLREAVLNMSNHTHSDYGKFWTIDQIQNLVSPCPGITQTVQDFFMNHSIKCDDYGDALKCVGDRQVVFDLFNVNSLGSEYAIPKPLEGLVEFVEGLSKRRHNGIVPKINVSGMSIDVDPGYVGVEPVRKLYNISAVNVSEDVVAVEYQGESGFSNDDLIQSQKQNGLVANPITSNHNIGSDGEPDTETELDIQMLAYANNVTIWYWGSDAWLWTWAVNFFNTPVVPYVASHSWGWAIDQQCTIIPCNTTDQAYVNRVNIEYLKIAARGVTMLTASGDSGAPGRSDESCQGINRTVVSIFPGSSPYVLSVGATFVAQSASASGAQNWTTPLCQQNGCTYGNSEAVVNFANVSWTAGGGFGVDVTEVRPVWQAEAVRGYFAQHPPLPSNFNPLGRAYPDISTVGHNCPTWQNNYLSQVDGTSCSSPMMGSIIALINSHQRSMGKPRLGLAAPILYAMYYSDPTIFNDITVGNNWCTESMCCPTRSNGGSDYGYVATKGFDPVTGLGTPNVGKMLSWLDIHT